LSFSAFEQQDLRDAYGDSVALTDVHPQDFADQPGPGPVRGRPVQNRKRDRGVSLFSQFPDAGRNQHDAGSCHTFAAIGLLEAAYFRQYGQTVRLSDADLFLNRTVLNSEFYGDLKRSDSPEKIEVDDGGYIPADTQFALDHGVATDLQYEDFLTRYLAYSQNVQNDMRFVKRLAAEGSAVPDWMAKLVYKLTGNPEDKYIDSQMAPEAQKTLQSYMQGVIRDSQLASQRVESQKRLAGFKLLTVDFDYLGDTVNHSLAAADCATLGIRQGQDILVELRAGRPVGVAMTLKGLDSWGQRGATTDANHAFIIAGYAPAADGKLVFKTRNSWGGDNPDVLESDLCRIYQLSSLRAPKDR
jgi:hypothetical protein